MDRGDLPLEEASLLGGDGTLLRLRCELVLLLTRHVLELGHVLGGVAHAEVVIGDAAVEG